MQELNALLPDRNNPEVANGAIVDAAIINAPSSTKNEDDKLPEMQETAKGQQWYFGMKAHIAVDGKSKLIHTVLVAGANVADALALRHLLHGKRTRVWGDQASRGQKCGGTQSAGLHQPALSLG